MKVEKIGKIIEKYEELDNFLLHFSTRITKIEMDIKRLEKKIEELNHKIDENYFENLQCDELIIQKILNKNCH